MMLHEAVMLEIYRQALNASELASPRCQSRESNASATANNDVRCPSNESNYSGNDRQTPEQTPTPTTPPIGLPLPATLAPAAAVALLPPQSAAMAAYFNAAAAAAAQQNHHHLLLTNPLAAAATLVQQATQQQQQQTIHSPNSQHNLTPTPPSNSSEMVDTTALDFSTKHSRRNSEDEVNGSDEDNDDGGGAGDEADDAEQKYNATDNANDNETDDLNSPLDLSVNNGRKRQSDEEEPVMVANRKLARSNDYKSLPASSTWVPPINPYLAAVAAANMSPKTTLALDWNSPKTKIQPNEATKALEKMTEMTRLGGSVKCERNNSPQKHIITNSTNSSTTTSTSSSSTTSNGRHSAWQSHWLNKGADAVKDVFKCVWCKQSFATLASLTTHMKETQHCGVNVPPSVSSNAGQTNSGGNQTTQSSHHSRHSTTQSSANAAAAAVAALTANNTTTSGGSSKSDLNMLIKETMPLPRKLVRGQDVWLGKGAEQTRQILKCMWCGQSFRSLAEMTSHMQETQHYTNIISQEQIISWKSTDEKGSRDNSTSSNGGSGNRGSTNAVGGNTNSTVTVNNSAASPNANSTVSAVLTCKVCDQAFSTLKELSNHMVKNNHYKEHMMRTAAAVENVPTMIRGRGRQAREKRKKSLPVRKLLEMERAQHDFKAAGLDQALKPLRDFAASTKITCEKCGDKVETALFVDHIRQCIDASLSMSPRSQQHNNNNTLKSPYAPITTQERLNSPQTPHSRSDGRKTSEGNISPLSSTTSRADILCPLPPDAEKSTSGTSVLNALEQLIEKSFDSRPRHSSAYGDNSSGGTPLGSSILKRLGIEDNVDYTKPLMDPQTMQFLRSYSQYPSNRDRSASESSSISERCSSRLESYTPERSHDLSRQPTPRLTPDKHLQNAKESRESMYGVKIKSEPIDNHDLLSDADNIPINEIPKKISVKKEFNIPEEQEDLDSHKLRESDIRHNSMTPSSRAISPSNSERSITPKSSSSFNDKKSSMLLPESSSLNALSSMFNNLNNMTNTTLNSSNSNIEANNNNTSLPTKKSNANPLAALQKLCDTTDTSSTTTRSSSNNNATHSASSSSSSSNNTNNMGAGAANTTSNNASMLAFSWACNDAIVTADSIIKCSFCDTPFSSKGAYRHHLSKVHFVKEEPSDLSHLKSPGGLAASSPKSMTSPKSVSSAKSPATQRLESTPPSSVATTPTINPYDESPQSKFLKYTELAKQLSSKNV